MARSRGKIEVVCQNPRCRYYLKEKGKDIIKSGKYKSTGHQRYYCKHLVEKNGIRSIERITGHHRGTIGRLLEDMAEHAEVMNAYLIKNLGLTPFECDELWSFVKKKTKTVEPRSQNRSEECDTYIYTCIKRNTYFFVAFSVGK